MQVIDQIEVTAKNKLLPREKIVDLCDEARRAMHVRFEKSNPVREAVMRAVENTTVDDDGLVHMDGEYMTTMRLLYKCGLQRTPANLARVGMALVGLGYVKLARTKIHPQSRWFAPRAIV
jgi:hypothetical protein